MAGGRSRRGVGRGIQRGRSRTSAGERSSNTHRAARSAACDRRATRITRAPCGPSSESLPGGIQLAAFAVGELSRGRSTALPPSRVHRATLLSAFRVRKPSYWIVPQTSPPLPRAPLQPYGWRGASVASDSMKNVFVSAEADQIPTSQTSTCTQSPSPSVRWRGARGSGGEVCGRDRVQWECARLSCVTRWTVPAAVPRTAYRHPGHPVGHCGPSTHASRCGPAPSIEQQIIPFVQH
jgi:hypothetical protein